MSFSSPITFVSPGALPGQSIKAGRSAATSGKAMNHITSGSRVDFMAFIEAGLKRIVHAENSLALIRHRAFPCPCPRAARTVPRDVRVAQSQFHHADAERSGIA